MTAIRPDQSSNRAQCQCRPAPPTPPANQCSRPDSNPASTASRPSGCGRPNSDRFSGSPDAAAPDATQAASQANIPNFANAFGGPQGGQSAAPSGGGQPGGGNQGGAGGPAGAAPVEQGGATGGADAAARAADLAKKYVGQPSQSLKGKLPGFTAPGGATNNCAAFVSACLENTGALKKGGGSASVSALRGKLKSAGWKKVPAKQAPKGAVWMTKQGQGSHTELVSTPGGTRTVGSNNNGVKGFQRISERGKNPNSGEYWAPPGAAGGSAMA